MALRPGLAFLIPVLVLAPAAGEAMAQPRAPAKKAKQAAARIVVPAGGVTIRFPLDENRSEETRVFTLPVRPALKSSAKGLLAEAQSDLLTEDGHSFPESQITPTATRSKFGSLRVEVKVDPDDVKPGRYTGTLTIGGPRMRPAAATVEVTMRDPKSEAILWALAGFVIGILVKIGGDLSRARTGGDNTEVDASAAQGTRLRDYLTATSFWTSLLLGLLGAITAYALTYHENPTWGADSLDNWKLAAAAFAGVLTGAAGADIVKPFTGKR